MGKYVLLPLTFRRSPQAASVHLGPGLRSTGEHLVHMQIYLLSLKWVEKQLHHRDDGKVTATLGSRPTTRKQRMNEQNHSVVSETSACEIQSLNTAHFILTSAIKRSSRDRSIAVTGLKPPLMHLQPPLMHRQLTAVILRCMFASPLVALWRVPAQRICDKFRTAVLLGRSVSQDRSEKFHKYFIYSGYFQNKHLMLAMMC